MCTLDNIKLAVVAVVAVRVIMGLLLLIIGGIYGTNPAIVQGYGSVMVEYGAGIAMLGVTALLTTYPMFFAIKRHNRFVLLVVIILDLIILTQQISVGLNCVALTVQEFSTGLQEDCLKHKPAFYSPEECQVYWRSTRTAGFRVVWAAYFTNVNDPVNYQVLSDFEQQNGCCGFGPPMSCQNDTRPFPSQYPIDSLRTSFQKQRVVCGEVSGYYRSQVNCLDYSDPNSIPPVVGGCQYDMGASTCRKEDVSDSTRGCALAVEVYLADLVGPTSIMTIGSSIITLLNMFVNIVMFLKRKEYDVFPEYINVDVKKSKFANWERIKDNVVVVPAKDYLYEKGFLPRETRGNTDTATGHAAREEQKEETPATDIPTSDVGADAAVGVEIAPASLKGGEGEIEMV